MVSKVRKNRQSNIELLRIVSMLMIVASHYSIHGEFEFNTGITIPKLWVQWLQLGGGIGVNIFMLISGYFLINVEKIDFSKILRYLGQVFFYSFSISTIIKLFHLSSDLTLTLWLKSLIPLCSGIWWYATAYFLVYLCVPYLNKMLKNITQKQHLILILILFFMWSVVGMFYPEPYAISDVGWLIFLYTISAYIALYLKNNKFKHMGIIGFGTYVLLYLSAVFLDVIGKYISVVAAHETALFRRNGVVALLASIGIFLFFKNLNVKDNKLINTVASTTFGVYLIHEYPVRSLLWEDIFNNQAYANTNSVFIHSVAVIIVVFIVCAIVEFVRQKTVEKIWLKQITKINTKLQPRFEKIMNYLVSKSV